MTRALRCLPLLALLLLGACQSPSQRDAGSPAPQAQVPTAPGLGVELDVQAASRFPYEPAYLPVNRLTDGTVHDW